MRALSIRQPYAELILRGIKTAELRSVSTNIIGERFYIYASKGKAKRPIWSDDLRVADPPGWMIELARQVRLIEPDAILPTGVIVGSACIERCSAVGGWESGIRGADADRFPLTPESGSTIPVFAWHLTNVRRLGSPLKPERRPQPVWFRPF